MPMRTMHTGLPGTNKSPMNTTTKMKLAVTAACAMASLDVITAAAPAVTPASECAG